MIRLRKLNVATKDFSPFASPFPQLPDQQDPKHRQPVPGVDQPFVGRAEQIGGPSHAQVLRPSFDQFDPNDFKAGVGRQPPYGCRSVGTVAGRKSIGFGPAAQPIDKLMEAVWGEPGDHGHVVGFVGRLEQEYSSPLEHTGNLAEDGERVRQVFEDIVGEDDIEGGVGIGDTASVSNFALVQHRIVDDAGIEVDATDFRGQSPKVHLLDDARAEIEDDRYGGEMLENALAEDLVVPVAGETGIEGAVELFGESAHQGNRAISA